MFKLVDWQLPQLIQTFDLSGVYAKVFKYVIVFTALFLLSTLLFLVSSTINHSTAFRVGLAMLLVLTIELLTTSQVAIKIEVSDFSLPLFVCFTMGSVFISYSAQFIQLKQMFRKAK